MIQIAALLIRVMHVLNGGAGKVPSIIQHMKMSNFGLRTLKNFLMNWGHVQMDAQLIALIRSVITNPEMFDGQPSCNKRRIACQETIG